MKLLLPISDYKNVWTVQSMNYMSEFLLRNISMSTDCCKRLLRKSLTMMPAVLNRHSHGMVVAGMDSTGYTTAARLHHCSGSTDFSQAGLARLACRSASTASWWDHLASAISRNVDIVAPSQCHDIVACRSLQRYHRSWSYDSGLKDFPARIGNG